MPGPHPGTGIAALAAWWLMNMCEFEEECDAAAAPAITTAQAKMRIASFIVGYPFAKTIDTNGLCTNTFMLEQILK